MHCIYLWSVPFTFWGGSPNKNKSESTGMVVLIFSHLPFYILPKPLQQPQMIMWIISSLPTFPLDINLIMNIYQTLKLSKESWKWFFFFLSHSFQRWLLLPLWQLIQALSQSLSSIIRFNSISAFSFIKRVFSDAGTEDGMCFINNNMSSANRTFLCWTPPSSITLCICGFCLRPEHWVQTELWTVSIPGLFLSQLKK